MRLEESSVLEGRGRQAAPPFPGAAIRPAIEQKERRQGTFRAILGRIAGSLIEGFAHYAFAANPGCDWSPTGALDYHETEQGHEPAAARLAARAPASASLRRGSNSLP